MAEKNNGGQGGDKKIDDLGKEQVDQNRKDKSKAKFLFGLGIGGIVLLIGILVLVFAVIPSVASNRSLIIDPKVIVYDEESSPFKIIASDDESVTVSSLDGIADDSIINAGTSEETPNGLLRKVVSTEPVDGGYRIATRPAALSEAIEKCDVRVTVTMMEDGTYAVTQTGEAEESNPFIQQAFADDNEDENESEETLDNLFSVTENAFSASAGIMVEVDLKIESGEVSMRVVDHFQARLSLNSLNGSLEKELFNKPLKPFTFMVGPVFVVFTNEFNILLNAEASTSLLGFNGTAALDRKIGFEYSTAEGLKPVSEDKSKAPGLSLKPEGELFGLSLGGALTGTLSSHLYGFAGPELSAALDAETEARLQKIPDGDESEGAISVPGIDWNLRGRFAAKVSLPISGTFVAKVPNFNPFDTSRDPVEFVNVKLFNTEDAISLIDFKKEFGTIVETLPNTFTTELYTKMGEPGPALTFGFPDNWAITEHRTNQINGSENLTLLSESGVEISFDYSLIRQVGGAMLPAPESVEVLSDTRFSPVVYPDISQGLTENLPRVPLHEVAIPQQSDKEISSLSLVVAKESRSVNGKLWETLRVIPKVTPQDATLGYMNEHEPEIFGYLPYYYGWISFSVSDNGHELTAEEEAEALKILTSLNQTPAPADKRAEDGIVGTWKCEIETGGASGFYLETWTINADGTAQFGTRQGRASYTWERTGQTNAEGAEEYRFDLIEGTEEGNPPSQELSLYYDEATDELSGGYIGDSFIRQ